MVGARLLFWGTAVLATSQVFCTCCASCRLDRIETSLLKRNISILCSFFLFQILFAVLRVFDETLGNLDKISEHSTEKKFIAGLLPPQDGLFLASVRSFCSVLAASAWGTHLVGLVRQFRFNATYLTVCRGFDLLFWTRCFFGSRLLEFPHRGTARIRYERCERI